MLAAVVRGFSGGMGLWVAEWERHVRVTEGWFTPLACEAERGLWRVLARGRIEGIR